MTIFVILNLSILLMLLAIAITITFSNNLINSIILFTVFSFLMALEYLILSAPDVAITEAAVGVGIGTILMISVLSQIDEKVKVNKKRLSFSLIVIILTALALFYGIQGMPEFGDYNARVHQHLTPYYIVNSYIDIGIPNVVTSILANYRAFDTLGEVYVIFIAGISVMMILQKDKKK